MRLIAPPLAYGLLGVLVLGLSLLGGLPDRFAFAAYPGSMLSFALIQGQFSALVVFGVGAIVQFVVYAFVGMIVSIVVALCGV